jgi:anti-anti-sigma factor
VASTDSHCPDLRSARSAPSGGTVVLRLSGEVDVASCRALDHRLREAGGRTVVDLSDVAVLSAAAIGVLIAHAERLASTDGRLLVVAGTPDIRRLLRVTEAENVLETFDSVPEAVAAIPRPRHHGRDPVVAWRLDLRGGADRGLRRRLRTQPTVARALGVLQERYRLADSRTAFDLLRDSSQRYNLRLHIVAAALLAAPAPGRSRDGLWFPGRLRHAAPPLTFPGRSMAHDGNRTAVLDAVLDAVSACVDTDAADLQMTTIGERSLYLERHRGLTAELLSLIDSGESPPTVPTVAVSRRTRVVVADVAVDPVLTDPTERIVLLAGGSRAMQSSPLLMTSGEPAGAVTTHHPRPNRTPTPAEHAGLDGIVAEAGAWLEWHRRTVVLDALEQVHQAARTVHGRPRGDTAVDRPVDRRG